MTGPTDEPASGVATKPIGRLYPDAPQPAPYASPRNRERQLRIALMMAGAAAVLTALAALERYRFTSEALRLGAVSPAREDAVAQHRTITYFVIAVIGLAAATLWLRWFSQVYGNLPSLGAAETRLSPSTAVVCCVLPFLNLIMAPRSIAEAWHVSDPEGDRRRYAEDAKGWPSGLAAIWSPVGLLTLVAAAFGLKMSPPGLDHLERVRSGSLIEVGAAVLLVMTVLLTARLAADLTARQELRAEQLEATA
jgi:hypothetical protein